MPIKRNVVTKARQNEASNEAGDKELALKADSLQQILWVIVH